MKLSNQKQEKVYRYNLLITREEAEHLKHLGLETIQNDDQALIEYAVLRLLEDQIKYLSDKEDIENGTDDKCSGEAIYNPIRED